MRNLCADTQHSLIEQIESTRDSRVLVLAASHLEMELLPVLYDVLCEMGQSNKLDVLLYIKGGEVNAARRVALLLREFGKQLTYIVPHHCQSSGTLLTFSGDEIIAGPMAMFSPIDPHLNADGAEQGGPSAMSAEDIRVFADMACDWFNQEPDSAKEAALSILSNSIFPTTLTSFYRATQELQKIGVELLQYQFPNNSVEQQLEIVNKLLFEFYSHSYAITREELSALGLKVQKDEVIEALAWDISSHIRSTVGGNVRSSLEEPWNDVMLASRQHYLLRKKQQGQLSPEWIKDNRG